MVMRNAELALGSDHADANCFALALRVFQPCLFRVGLRLERLGQGRKLATDVFEEEPPLGDFGHVGIYSTGCHVLRKVKEKALSQTG